VSNREAGDKRHRQRVADLTGSILLVALGALFAIGGIGYGLQRGGRIGPGFMPLLGGSALIAFAILVGLEALRRDPVEGSGAAASGNGTATKESVGQGDRDSSVTRRPLTVRVKEKPYRFVAVVMVLTSSTVLLVQLLGFLVACALLIFILVAAVEGQGWRSALLISVGATAITWLIFVRLLAVPLPTGVLGEIVGT
jgi:putative tricarboxylic transport membrane protein